MRHIALRHRSPPGTPQNLEPTQYSRLVEVVPRFLQGKSAPGCRRAALVSLMWNGVDTTSRATIPGWEDSRHATMSCDLVLQLGFSFCQNGSSCSGLLMSWHIEDIRQVEHSTKARCIDHLHTRTHIYTYIHTQLYLYLVNTRLSLPEVGHDCVRLSLGG